MGRERELGRLCSGRWEGLAQSARLWREVWGEVLPRQNPLHRGRHFGAERGQVSILQGNVCGRKREQGGTHEDGERAGGLQGRGGE